MSAANALRLRRYQISLEYRIKIRDSRQALRDPRGIMPIYEYECENKHRFEKWQSMKDDPIKECPECGTAVRKILHPAGIIFKGSGWYITDSRKSDSAGAGEAKAGKDESKSEGKGEGTVSKSEAKSEEKKESSSESKSESKSEPKASSGSGSGDNKASST